MAVNSPKSKEVSGSLISAIFKHGLFDYGNYTFAILTTSGARKGLDPEFNTWSTPAHISKLNSDLFNPLKTYTCSMTYSTRNDCRYENSGALYYGGSTSTQYPFPLPDRRILLSHPDLFTCDVVWLFQLQMRISLTFILAKELCRFLIDHDNS